MSVPNCAAVRERQASPGRRDCEQAPDQNRTWGTHRGWQEMGTAVTLTKEGTPGVLTADHTSYSWSGHLPRRTPGRGGLAGDMRTMDTAKGHIKALSYRKLTSFLGFSCPPPGPATSLQSAPLSCCPFSHLSPVWSCPDSCGTILMPSAQGPQPSADRFLRSLLGYL